MPSKRDISLSKYDISKERYRELYYFCQQYKDIEAIEQCAVAADPEIYQYVIKSVTEGVKYEFLKVPASRKKFYRARRKFFYLLDRKKG